MPARMESSSVGVGHKNPVKINEALLMARSYHGVFKGRDKLLSNFWNKKCGHPIISENIRKKS